MFITFEGVEGSGKTTQIHKLAQFLRRQGKQVLVTREPGGTPIAEKIRDILLDRENSQLHYLTELLLYAASRAQHVHQLIMPALAQGQVVLCDRFVDSSLAYQGYGRGLEPELIHRLNCIAVQGLTPDLTFLLDLPVEEGLERIRTERGSLDRLELEELAFHQRVREGYLALAKQEPDRIKVVDGRQDETAVFQVIIKILGY